MGFNSGLRIRRLAYTVFLLFLQLEIYGTVTCAEEERKGGSVEERSPVHSLSVTSGVDFVFSSFRDELLPEKDPADIVKVNSAIPVSLRYALSFNSNKIPHYFPGGYQGVGVEFYNFGAAQSHGMKRARNHIGYPVAAYLFQGGPVCSFGSSLSLNYEWNFGAAFGWKPFSATNDRINLIVGSRVNAYLNLGLTLNWKLNKNVSLMAGVVVNHFSNGNTSFPNPGVNSAGIKVGLTYVLNPPANGFESVTTDTLTQRRVEYDILLWGASRKRVYKGGETPVLLKGHFGCAGISFAPMYRLNSWWRVGGALDIQWDQSSDLKRNHLEGTTPDDIKFRTPRFARQLSVGLSAHGELQMPIFAVNIGCGYNLLAPHENRGSYQNISLKTYFGRLIFLNIGYQLRNFHQQSSLMLGLGLTL